MHLINLLRIHQWSKNFLLFIPLILSQNYDINFFIKTFIGFLSFSIIASSGYIVNDIIEIIIGGLQSDNKVKIHNFGTFKLNNKGSRIGRNPKTREEYNISSRNVITFKASKKLLKYINSNIND